MHDGLDIAAPGGTPVRTTADGTVVMAGKNGRYGKIVVVAHGHGLESRYAHLSNIRTKQGRQVEQGQCIGEIGATGNATGPHLHYEIRVNGRPVNPEIYLPKP